MQMHCCSWIQRYVLTDSEETVVTVYGSSALLKTTIAYYLNQIHIISHIHNHIYYLYCTTQYYHLFLFCSFCIILFQHVISSFTGKNNVISELFPGPITYHYLIITNVSAKPCTVMSASLRMLPDSIARASKTSCSDLII